MFLPPPPCLQPLPPTHPVAGGWVAGNVSDPGNIAAAEEAVQLLNAGGPAWGVGGVGGGAGGEARK